MRKWVLMGLTALLSIGLLISPVSASVVDPGTGAMDSLEDDTTESEDAVSEDAISTEVTSEEESSDEATESTEVKLMSDDELIGSTATIDDVDEYVEDKGGQIIHVVQKVCSYIVGVLFVVCFVVVIVGAVGNKQLLSKGGLGCLICLIVYCAIYFGPALLEWFRVWSTPRL